jgi:hypothetical protein
LLKILIRSRSFLLESLESLRYKIISSANRNNLTSSFPFEFLLLLSLDFLFWQGIPVLY